MQDRVSLYPGRVKLVPVSGQENTYDMVRADEPTQEGTPLSKSTFLKDTTAAMFGLGTDAVPDDVFSYIRGKAAITKKVVVAAGQTISAGDVVDVFSTEASNIPETKALKEFPLNSLITLQENGVDADYIVSSRDYEPGLNGGGRVLLVRKYVAEKGLYNSSDSALYVNSDLDQYMTAFANRFDSNLQDAIGSTNIKVANSSDVIETVARSVFALSASELGGWLGQNTNDEGAALPNYERFLTDGALADGSKATYWLRSKEKGTTAGILLCNTTFGKVDNNAGMAQFNLGYRPALTMNADYVVTGKPAIEKATKAGTPSQAIALNSGNDGDTIEVIYSGTVCADWATSGQRIGSEGVIGVGVLDGFLSVAGAGTSRRVVFGTYTGDGKYPRSIELGFRPKAVLVVTSFGHMNDRNTYYGGLFGPGWPYQSGSIRYADVVQTGFRLLEDATNKSGILYYYLTFE